MKFVLFLASSLALFTYASTALSATKVWLIGGGNTLENSQGQIEENVKWLQDLLNEKGIENYTYYTNGENTEDDVIYFATPEERDINHETFMRVFGNGLEYAKKTKRNSISKINGGTEKASLIKSLKAQFASVKPNDKVLIVYNGHGDIEPSDTRKNTLKLWGDTRLSISELDQLLDEINPKAKVNFVLTQCFSGSFANLIYEHPYSDVRAEQQRCGFLAESDRREAEGCDLGTNEADFRDYTTYFFAALAGKTRLGETIPSAQTDLDRSGQVSLREAHFYALANADSGDLSRSTSEFILERGQPWYTRWDSRYTPNEATYKKIAINVAKRENIAHSGPALAREFYRRLQTEKVLEQDIKKHAEVVKNLQEDLRRQVEVTKDTAAKLSSEEQLLLSKRLTELPSYAKLVFEQNHHQELNANLLEAHRDTAQAEKVLRLNHLARLEQHQRSDTSEDLQAVTSCETEIAFPETASP